MKKGLLFMLIFAAFINCKSTRQNELLIDLSGLSNIKNVNIVISRFELNADNLWTWTPFDSIRTNSNVFYWPRKYDTPFLANLNIYDDKNLIIGLSEEFIYSKSSLIVKRDDKSSLINIPGKYKNAASFKIQGGENILFNDKTFLLPPNFKVGRYQHSKVQLTKEETIAYDKWQKYQSLILDQVEKHPDQYYTLFRLLNIVSFLSDSIADKCYGLLHEDLKNIKEGRYLHELIQNASDLNKTRKLPVFNVSTQQNKIIRFNNILKSKYYFIDFWASWCGPCRHEMQSLKSIYMDVDTNKIQFISLSVDTQKENWFKALGEEQLKWPNYVQGDSDLLKLFALKYIPQNFLLDSRNMIIARNLTQDELRYFLKKVY